MIYNQFLDYERFQAPLIIPRIIPSNSPETGSASALANAEEVLRQLSSLNVRFNGLLLESSEFLILLVAIFVARSFFVQIFFKS